MIRTFGHKALERFSETGTRRGIQGQHERRIRLILGRLQVSTAPRDMNLPGLFLHELMGQRSGVWSVRVSGNWRITFRFKEGDAYEVDYEDYH